MVLAVAVACCLMGLAAAWWYQGGARGELVQYQQLRHPANRPTITFQVDINAAPWPELAELPRIGPTLARRIVEHREAHGPFRTAEDLRRVRGIGPQTLREILPCLAPLSSKGGEQ